MNRKSRNYVFLLVTVVLSGQAVAVDNASNDVAADKKLFASVGPVEITDAEYNRALQQASRKKFYHGTPPEGAMDELRHVVAREVITRTLLLQEAERLGLKADEAAIDANIAEFDRRYANSERWQQQRETMVVTLARHYREQDLLQQLESRQRSVAPPEERQLKQFYRENLDKFTEPAQNHLSLILLKVDPSAAKAVWDAALAEGADLVSRLADGADFSELAKLHSSDSSARQGGDMGYLHAGMLSAAAENEISRLKVGEVSSPVRLLEGIAVFRLEDRKAARLREYEEVSKRARELWLRDQQDQAWARLKETLWEKTPISIHNASLSLDSGG
jgi:parvulin-like peptidyl-prolyl isomerase